MSHRIQDFKECYAANDRLVLFDSTAKCNSTLGPTVLYAISNDPIGMSINFSLEDQTASEAYNLLERYEDLGIDSDDCDPYTYLARWNTTLIGLCASEMEHFSSLRSPLLEEECIVLSDYCVSNDTTEMAEELYHGPCRARGGAPYRQPERTVTCLDDTGHQRLQYTPINISSFV